MVNDDLFQTGDRLVFSGKISLSDGTPALVGQSTLGTNEVNALAAQKNGSFIIVLKRPGNTYYGVYQFSMDGYSRLTGKHWVLSDVSTINTVTPTDSVGARFTNGVAYPEPLPLNPATYSDLESALKEALQKRTNILIHFPLPPVIILPQLPPLPSPGP